MYSYQGCGARTLRVPLFHTRIRTGTQRVPQFQYHTRTRTQLQTK